MFGRWHRERKPLHRAIERHGEMVYRLAYRVLRNPADAEDAAQEVFIKLLRLRRSTTNGVRNERAWLSITSLNTARKILRESRNRRKRETWVAENHHHRPDERDAQSQEVWQAVDALPDELRIPLILHVQEGLKYREIAEAMGCPEGTVGSRISDAKARMRSILQKSGAGRHA